MRSTIPDKGRTGEKIFSLGVAMMDISQGEKAKLYQWACDCHTKELEERYFIMTDEKCGSYFEKRSHQTVYCKKYVFQTMPELRSELNAMWEDDDVMKQIEKTVLVASMKNKLRVQRTDKRDDDDEKIAPFIYSF